MQTLTNEEGRPFPTDQKANGSEIKSKKKDISPRDITGSPKNEKMSIVFMLRMNSKLFIDQLV